MNIRITATSAAAPPDPWGRLVLWAAAQTVLTHGAQLLGAGFRLYAWLSLVLALLAGAATLAAGMAAPHRRDWRVSMPLVLAGLLGAGCALLVNRPSIDDFLYVPDAVWHLQHPGAAMGFASHYLYSEHGPYRLFAYDTAGAFELTQAAAAYLLGIEYLDVYHLIAPALMAFAFPFIYFRLLGDFTPRRREAALAVLLMVGLMLLMGDTHRTLGSFSFTRMFQGKTVLMTVGLPLAAHFCLEYFRRRDGRALLHLAAVATSLAGLTSSAFVMLPIFWLVLLLAWQMGGAGPLSLRQCVAYGASLAYVALCALAFAWFAFSNLGSGSAVNEGWPTTFAGHARFFLDAAHPFTPLVVLLSATVTAWWLRGWPRRFLVAWIGVCLLLLNPLVAPALIQYVTSPNIYWRLFYLLPFPLVLGLALAGILERIPAGRGRTLFCLASCVSLLGGHFVPGSTSIFRRPEVLGWGAPSFKIRPDSLTLARQLAAQAPPGLMLAPGELSGALAMIDGRFPQIRVSEATLRMLLAREGRRAEAERRIHASEYTAGYRSFFADFAHVVAGYTELRSIVIRRSVLDDACRRLTESRGFRPAAALGDFLLLVRQP